VSIELLKSRINDVEDSLTERKTSYSFSDAIKTIVGFANSVPENRTGVLFIGIDDKGVVIGVDNTDKMQKDIRNDCENKCYPPIYPNVVVLPVDNKNIVTIEVPFCPNRPYFAGPAYVRRGS